MYRRQLNILCIHVTLGIPDGIVEFLHNVLKVHWCPPVLLLQVLVPGRSLHDEPGHLAPGVQATDLLCPRLCWSQRLLSVCSIQIFGPVIDEHSNLKVN